jgi:ribosomal protein S18 acetylase RimI-like enzyme
MDAEWRRITHDDVPAWNALLAAAEKVDNTAEHYNEDDLHEELDNPAFGADDRISAWAEGRMVAFAGVLPRTPTTYWRIGAEGVVDPAYRGLGLGTEALRWVSARALALQRDTHPDLEVRLDITGYLGNTDQVRLLEDAGYTAVNWSATMRVALDAAMAESPATAWPAGYTLHGYARSWSAQVLAAHNAAFTDHWGFVPWSETEWRQWEDDSRNARPDMSWLLVADDQPDVVVGYVLTHEYDAHQETTGRREAYLAKIGVRREHRGRGLASRLLRHALRSYAAAGYDESSLDVDTNNPTGAFGLYERAGYVIESRTATFQKVLPPR